MGWPVCNMTEEYEQVEEDPVFGGWTFHQFGLAASATSTGIAVIVSFWLIFRHATHYLKPWEQLYIIRILFMVPIYSAVSFLSFYYYTHSIYFEVLRDCYEAIAIASFFTLLCHYIAPDLHSQKDYFRALKPKPWLWPLTTLKRCCGGEHGMWRTPRSGLTWFNIIWVGVFEYCFIRVFCTIVSVITEAVGLYCLESLNPAFAQVWVMCLEGTCVTIAMYCLIQFYYQLRADISEFSPFLKIVAIKLVIFLSFWQDMLISFLTSSGILTATSTFDTPDIKIGLPCFLLCVEMAFFSVLHIYAFPWAPYDISKSATVASETPGDILDSLHYQGGVLGWKAYVDATNPWDILKAVGRSAKWLFVGVKYREQDVSYEPYKHPGQQNTAFTGVTDTAYRGHDANHAPRDKYRRFGNNGDDQESLLHTSNQESTYSNGDIGDMRDNYPLEPLDTVYRPPGPANRSRDDSSSSDIGIAISPEGSDEGMGYHTLQGQSDSDPYRQRSPPRHPLPYPGAHKF